MTVEESSLRGVEHRFDASAEETTPIKEMQAEESLNLNSNIALFEEPATLVEAIEHLNHSWRRACLVIYAQIVPLRLMRRVIKRMAKRWKE